MQTAKMTYRFNVIPIRVLADFFIEIDKLTGMELQGIQNSQNNLIKKNKVEELMLPDFKTSYSSTLIKVV